MKSGGKGEILAAGFLKKKGYQVVRMNYRTPIGEIDIIATEGDTLVFVEVKSRESIEYGEPFESVNRKKRRKIVNVALLYLKGLKRKELPPCRFDVVSIRYEDDSPRFDLIKDAFEA